MLLGENFVNFHSFPMTLAHKPRLILTVDMMWILKVQVYVHFKIYRKAEKYGF